VVQSLGLDGFFLLWPFSVSCYLSLGLVLKLVQSMYIGNSKAAALVACRPSVLVHCKACKERKKKTDYKIRQKLLLSFFPL